jgi:hypothetical protein
VRALVEALEGLKTKAAFKRMRILENADCMVPSYKK